MLFYIIFCAIYFQYLSVHLAIISWLEDFPFLFFSSLFLRLPGVCSWLSNWYAIFSLFLLLHILIYVLFDFHIERERKRETWTVYIREYTYVLHVHSLGLLELSHVLIVFGLVICFHFWLLTAFWCLWNQRPLDNVGSCSRAVCVCVSTACDHLMFRLKLMGKFN